MKHKVAKLEGALLDAAVELAELPSGITSARRPVPRKFSSDWAIVGPLIERERIASYFGFDGYDGTWVAGYGLHAKEGRFWSFETGSNPPTIEFDGATGHGPTRSHRGHACVLCKPFRRRSGVARRGGTAVTRVLPFVGG